LSDENNPKSGVLVSDRDLATVWLSTGAGAGMAFKPYLVRFKAGTAISFYKDGKVQSGTLASTQDLIKSIPNRGGTPDYITLDEGTTVKFNKDGYLTDF
jgi:plastocyanin